MSNQTPSVSPTVPGQILAGKYRVERIIGQGGMGVVVEARHITLDERVALKFLLPEYATHPEASARFLREARAAVRIKSEHVARVSDVGTLDNGAPYMVMEFLEGRDLSKLLESGVLHVADAVDYIIQGCDALAEAHGHGIVHRDVKPANLFLTKRPNGTPQVKVLDFGISKTTGGQVDNLTKTSASMGSALYMSPEQMQTTRGVDHRTDIYALGISLYELLAGKQPFYADTLPQLCAEIFTGTPNPIRATRPDVPEGLAVVLEKAYARDRGMRYQSIGEFVLALAPYAPPRSQVAIDSVAQMTGLETRIAGAPAPAPVPVLGATPSGSQPYLVAGQAGFDGGAAQTARSSGVGYPPGPPGSGVPLTTGPGVSVVTASSIPTTSRAPLIVALALFVGAVFGGGAYFMLRRSASTAAATTTVTAAAPAAPADTGAVTAATAAPPTVATVIATAAPVASAAPVATAAPTAAAAVVTRAGSGTRPRGAVAPVVAAPVVPTKPPPVRDPAGF